MKKTIFIILIMMFFFSFSADALDTPLLGVRNKIFGESREIKSLLPNAKDVVLVSSMWDSCIMAVTQLDAYCSMLGVFNAIKKEDLNEGVINYLTSWLSTIKKTNELNIKSLNAVVEPIEPKTKVYVERLKEYFNELNKTIDTEINKFSILRQSLKIK